MEGALATSHAALGVPTAEHFGVEAGLGILEAPAAQRGRGMELTEVMDASD